MLDVLEAFLNIHGHTYLRLDGGTRVEERQHLMERFNADPRIFLFILSTRAGGLGVNLVGADTVIFYDSDWNPAMDQQAQDRCHRIGQTRGNRSSLSMSAAKNVWSDYLFNRDSAYRGKYLPAGHQAYYRGEHFAQGQPKTIPGTTCADGGQIHY